MEVQNPSLRVYHWNIGSQCYTPPDERSVSFKKHVSKWSPPFRKGWGDEQAHFTSYLEVISTCIIQSGGKQK